jgi:chromosome segregation protein
VRRTGSCALSSLTLKGFKSFASATTLRLEPGITAVVGPNGSGKSNVVDAIAWVLGEQGAKSLRGGKMEDVIFAGTAGRPALGRAEVTLTIDNTDGALPIDYTEVSITRRMYRSGESEYEINGDKVRLLDVQELLSDSGIGREMHVIVGQGQLDAVLSGRPRTAAPSSRRPPASSSTASARRRRSASSTRCRPTSTGWPTSPPSCAASSSRWAGRPRSPGGPRACRPTCATPGCGLLADDLVQLRDALDADVADETAARERRAAVEAELARASRRESARGAGAATPRCWPPPRTPWYRTVGPNERFQRRCAAGRRAAPATSGTGFRGTAPHPVQLEPEADRSRHRGQLAPGRGRRAGGRLTAAVAPRRARGGAGREELRAWSPPPRARRTPRGPRPRSVGVAAPRSRPPPVRPGAALALAPPPRPTARPSHPVRLEQRPHRRRRADDEDARWSPRTPTPSNRCTPSPPAPHQLAVAERAAERDRASWAARRDTLAQGLAPADGAAAVLSAGASGALAGVLGPVAERITVAPGAEVALAAALGGLAEAVVVTGGHRRRRRPGAPARRRRRPRRAAGHRRAGPVAAGGPARAARGTALGPRPRRGPRELRPALSRVLDRVAVVPTSAPPPPGGRGPVGPGGHRRRRLVGSGLVGGEPGQRPSGLEVRARVGRRRPRSSTPRGRPASRVGRRLAAARENAGPLHRRRRGLADARRPTPPPARGRAQQAESVRRTVVHRRGRALRRAGCAPRQAL